PTNSKLYREYIGADGNNIRFSDVPINPNVDFHFILSFAIDYTNTASPTPTNGDFSAFWDTNNLSPSQVSSIKAHHPNVKVAMSLGGDTVNNHTVFYSPATISSWVRNAISSINRIVKENNLDGIDIDYEHFHADPNTFTECIGQLIFNLKQIVEDGMNCNCDQVSRGGKDRESRAQRLMPFNTFFSGKRVSPRAITDAKARNRTQ
ncbi:hypothetical protein HYC85_000040, partial [Camellia sinensis]